MSNRKLSPAARQCCPHCGGELAPAAPAAPRRSAGAFADHDAFVAAFTAAAARATAECGARWMLNPAARVMARVPAAWVNYRVFRRAVTGRRDTALPAARFWPDGTLPVGPDYAAEPPRRAPGELHRAAAARCARERDDALHFAAIAETTPRRHRWIGEAHAAERAMMDNLRLADRAEAGAPEPWNDHPAVPDTLPDGTPNNPPRYVHEDEWPAAPAPVQPPAAPAAPVAPAAPRRPVQPRPEPAANPVLLAWWHDAAASWRAYQSPADHAALARCQEGIAVLLAALPDATRREPMIRAVKAGRAFPTRWFATERNTG